MKNQKLYRPKQLICRVTLDELYMIQKKMKEAKLKNFSMYARHMLLSGEIHVIDFDMMKQLRYEINRIGTNINQVVKMANENNTVTQDSIEQLVIYQKQLETIVNDYLMNKIKGI